METRKKRGVVALSAASVLAVAAVLAIASPKPPAAQRVPCLDGWRILGWIDGGRVVAIAAVTHTHPKRLDLRTGEARYLPGYTGYEFVYAYDRRQEIVDDYPAPSPDGRWLLYREQYLGKPDREVRGKPGVDFPEEGQEPERLRLTSLGDTPDHLIPARGFVVHHTAALVWLPDSSGWIALRKTPNGTLSLARYQRDAPDAPEPLATPTDLYYSGFGTVVRMISDGTLALNDLRNPGGLQLLSLSPGAKVQRVTPAFPDGTLPDVAAFGAFALDPDGRSVVVCVEAWDGRFQAWVHRLLKRPQVHWEFRRVSLADGSAQYLCTVPEKVVAFSLAPDGRSIVYWQTVDAGERKHAAYRVEVR